MSSAVPTDDEEGRGTMQRHRNTAWDSQQLPAYQTPNATQHSRACPGWRRRVCNASRGWINSVVYWPVQIKSRTAGPVYTHRLPWSISKQAHDGSLLSCSLLLWQKGTILTHLHWLRSNSLNSSFDQYQEIRLHRSVPSFGNDLTGQVAKKICWPFQMTSV